MLSPHSPYNGLYHTLSATFGWETLDAEESNSHLSAEPAKQINAKAAKFRSFAFFAVLNFCGLCVLKVIDNPLYIQFATTKVLPQTIDN